MQLYPGHTVDNVLHMPSLTLLALLNEGHKLDVYHNKMLLAISAYPHMDKDAQEHLQETLLLPDDVLSDILGDEEPDDINTLKEAINGN